MLNIDEQIFNENLLLTQTYCELQLQNTNSHIARVLRSFNPQYGGKELFSYVYDSCFTTRWHIDPLFEYRNLYNKLFDKQLVYKKERITETDPHKQFEGRILVAEVDLSFVDGHSQTESTGLIDSNDCPPIDTWFYMSKNKSGRVLYAWIPGKFIPLVNKAIDVNCVNCMHWHDSHFSSEEDAIPQKFQFKSVWANIVNSMKTTFV